MTRPAAKIKHMLAVRPQFIWVRTGEYVLADGIRLDEEESRLAEASMLEDMERQIRSFVLSETT